jgi:ubiquinone/menaquinone biosynthesis C-methylase UbiE
MAMEGVIARWYARNTVRNMAGYREAAEMVSAQLPSGASVLEVAPGPGYLAIELAKLGNYQVTGLDISQSFVRMATENAAKAGVAVRFEQGNAAEMPFAADSFEFIVCRAAFKNFSEPVRAIAEMHRVLKTGGKALILDLRPDASPEAIRADVKRMGLGWFNSMLTRFILRQLTRRAYSQEQFREMAAQTPFGKCDIRTDGVGLAVSLTK